MEQSLTLICYAYRCKGSYCNNELGNKVPHCSVIGCVRSIGSYLLCAPIPMTEMIEHNRRLTIESMASRERSAGFVAYTSELVGRQGRLWRASDLAVDFERKTVHFR